MQVEYDKTYYEQLIDVLEDAYLAGRGIKCLTLTRDEYKAVVKAMTNSRFITSLSRKIYIRNFELNTLVGDELLKGYLAYQVAEEQTQRSAKLNMVAMRIV
jgi:hypothetical protein